MRGLGWPVKVVFDSRTKNLVTYGFSSYMANPKITVRQSFDQKTIQTLYLYFSKWGNFLTNKKHSPFAQHTERSKSKWLQWSSWAISLCNHSMWKESINQLKQNWRSTCKRISSRSISLLNMTASKTQRGFLRRLQPWSSHKRAKEMFSA